MLNRFLHILIYNLISMELINMRGQSLIRYAEIRTFNSQIIFITQRVMILCWRLLTNRPVLHWHKFFKQILIWMSFTGMSFTLHLVKFEILHTWKISKTNLDEFYLKCKENNWNIEGHGENKHPQQALPQRHSKANSTSSKAINGVGSNVSGIQSQPNVQKVSIRQWIKFS